MRMWRPFRIPDRGHPLIRLLFQEMHRQQIGILDMADRTGINKNTFKDWRTRSEPRLSDLDACFQALGFELTTRRAPAPGSG